MFTGIVQGRGELKAMDDHIGGRRLEVWLPEASRGEIQVGASIAVAGVCLTVVESGPDWARFDVIAETLRLTTLNTLQIGEAVNIERAARFSDEIGGHLLSGHVSGTATVVKRLELEQETQLHIELPQALHPYILPKGFVAVDGISLTIGRVEDGCFSVHLIPETLRRTTLDRATEGTLVNIELDAMTQAVVDTVERVLAQRSQDSPRDPSAHQGEMPITPSKGIKIG